MRERECVCVCVCVCARIRERVCVSMCVHIAAYLSAHDLSRFLLFFPYIRMLHRHNNVVVARCMSCSRLSANTFKPVAVVYSNLFFFHLNSSSFCLILFIFVNMIYIISWRHSAHILFLLYCILINSCGAGYRGSVRRHSTSCVSLLPQSRYR